MTETPDTEESARKHFTGRTLVGLRRDVKDRHRIVEMVRQLTAYRYELGGRKCSQEEFEASTVIFPELGVATLDLRPSFVSDYACDDMPDVIIERERKVYSPQKLSCGNITPDPLGVMKVGTKWCGKDVKVAVLDTGYSDHIDFTGRQPQPIHLYGNCAVDTDGHGTHCTGLIGGPVVPCDNSQRYGVASEATLFNARVLKNRGSSNDTDVLSGMVAAWRERMDIINMSLGTPWRCDEPYSLIFEVVAYLMRKDGILLIAAAGNDAVTVTAPVEHPANCPSIVAVGALNHQYEPADFSCVKGNDCQEVDIAAPGECIRSTSLGNKYAYETGTSMSCAYVSGIAALWAEKYPKIRGLPLWEIIKSNTASVKNGYPINVGYGLVQAPQ